MYRKATIYEGILAFMVLVWVAFPIAFLFEIRKGFRTIWKRTYQTAIRAVRGFLNTDTQVTKAPDTKPPRSPAFIRQDGQPYQSYHKHHHHRGGKKHRHKHQTRW